MLKCYKLLAGLFMLFFCLVARTGNAQTWIVSMCSNTTLTSPAPSVSTGNGYGPMYSSSTANATSRMAVIYPASELSTITGASISNIYFHKGSTTAAMLGSANFKIYLKEVSALDWGTTSLDWATAIQGATLVYNNNPTSAIGTTMGWKNFGLTSNFSYSGTQNLAVFMEYSNTSASNAIVWSYEYTGPCVLSSNNNTSKYISNNTGLLGASLSSSTYRRPYIGFDYSFPNCTGTPATPVISSSVASPCPSTPFTLIATGFQIATGINYDWQKFSGGTWVSTGGTTPNYVVATGITAPTQYRLKTTCSLSSQQSISNTITVNVSAGLPGGTYTINNGAPTAGTNYHSFTEAIAAMNCGVTGPVVFNVTAGTPYNETIAIPNIPGTSAINKVRFKGNGAIVQFSNTATNTQLLTLNGARYVTIDSINFKALAADYGWGALITNNAAYDSITRCKFDLSTITSVSSSNINGITFSSSNTAPNTSGICGTHCYIGNNYLLSAAATGGMYYGINIAAGGNDSNVVVNNIVENFYTYGIYVSGASGCLIKGNDINRNGKSGSLTTFYGVALYGSSPGTKIIGNRIHNPMAATATSTSIVYGVYNIGTGTITDPILIANNLIYNLNQGGSIYGIYSSATPYTNIYHNTISIDKVISGTSTDYGMYISGTNTGLNVKNNIVSITAGSTGAKYGIYYSTSASLADAQRNNIYMNSSQAGTQYCITLNGNYTTLAGFQTANPTLEVGSTALAPQFTALATGSLFPGNTALFAKGTNLQADVTTDIVNIPRSSMPTPGAYEILSTNGNDAGALALASPVGTVCVGSQPVTVKIINGGVNIINNVQVYWSLNGTLQPVVSYNTPINTITSVPGNVATVSLGNVNFTTAPIAIKVWTFLPNGLADTFNVNDTLNTSVAASLSGTFTVNSALPASATNYQNFTTLANDLNAYGVCGPLTVNVAPGSGPYVEFVTFNNIPGTSAANKIKINGNGATVQFTNTTTNRQLLTLNGTKYITIDSLNFKALSPTFGWGALITAGAAFDTIKRCTFDLTAVTSTASTNTNGITFSGSNSSPTSVGSTGSNCYIGYNKVLGGTGAGGPYYALTAVGTQDSNVFDHNILHDFYYYGVYASGGTNLTINGNDINRSDKTAVTSFYGVYLTSAMPGLKVTGNRIHDPADPAATGTGPFYGIYATSATGLSNNRNMIANNAIYNVNISGGSVYSLYLPTIGFTDVYHNTVVIDKPLTGTGTIYGLYASGSSANATMKNNIVVITSGSQGTKYGMYLSSSSSLSDNQRNNIYVNSPQVGSQYYGFLNANYNTLADFQTANPTLEVGSLAVDPQFLAPASGNFTPGNYLLFGNGLNLTASVPTDILGVSRNSASTPGAFEIAPTGLNNAGCVSIITPKGSFCANAQPVNVSVVNAGTNNITSMKIHWQVNGVDQPVFNFNAPLNAITNGGQFIDTVLLGNADFASGNAAIIKVWTASPNNGNDVNNGNDTIQFTLQPSVFTVNAVKDTLCNNTATTINLSPATGYLAGNLNWQKSTNGTTWTDISNTDAVTYSTGNLTADNFYRVKINSGITGCYSDSVKIFVVTPQLISSTNKAICGPGTAALEAVVSQNALAKWYASPTASTPIGIGTPFTTPYLAATTTFYVSAGIGSSPSTCETAKVPVIATVNPVPQVDLGSDFNICVDSGYIGVLNAGVHPNAPTYLWDNGNTTQVRNYDTSGTYAVAVTNQFSCTGYDTVVVVLRENPKVALGNDTVICHGAKLVLDGGNDGIEYYWNTGQTSQTITVNATNNYSVLVTNNDGCTAADTIHVLTQGELPKIDGIVITNNGHYQFQFTAVNPDNVIGYDWDFGDNTAHSFQTSPVHTYADNGNYIVVLKISSTCGFLIDTASAHIVGIHQINVAANELMVFPNPTKDAATIINKGDLKMERIEIYNVTGQMVYKANADSNDKHTLQLNQLASGVYTVEIFTDKGNIARKLTVVR